ncbi:MAG: AAA family ATPase [archaeon GB-1867-005]|nr:AAA family ATPase [Candidatus Culexmicrobium cathedralense]
MILEVILENFMSYEFGRIPLKPGLNLICGPNGAGKSSILLGISVALGQAYTERGRRLSDLIRWGEKLARVSLIIDNSPKGRRRPYPKIHSNTIKISRYLRSDGSYWFEVNGKTKTKSEVQEILRSLGFKPDNMLIIMHQNMVEEFAVVPPKEKLRIFEDAIGLTHYRERINDIKNRLRKILKEEESVHRLLERAKTTLDFWRSEYEKLELRRKFERELNELKIEHAWAKVCRKEALIDSIEDKIRELEERISSMKMRIKRINLECSNLTGKINELTMQRKTLLLNLIEKSREAGRIEVINKLTGKIGRENIVKLFGSTSIIDLEEIHSKLAEIQVKINDLDFTIENLYEKYIESRVRLELLQFKLDSAKAELIELKRDLSRGLNELNMLISEAEALGPRPGKVGEPAEILDKIRMVELRLEYIGEVSEDVEQMYLAYSKTFEELSERIRILEQNRALLLNELEERVKLWRKVVSEVLSQINKIYGDILNEIGATGYVRLINAEDVDEAGLEILIGFRGNAPVVLDGYSQSGGERTTAVMAFLLAAQSFIKSPFRAVDEFDIHMDPRNREIISKLLVSSFSEGSNVQCIAITPSPIIPQIKNANIIVVQNVGGKSIVRSVNP